MIETEELQWCESCSEVITAEEQETAVRFCPGDYRHLECWLGNE